MWVIKLGGALLRQGELRDWLEACAHTNALPCTIVVGGGALADCVRSAQARWGYDDHLAHELALDTMAMNAQMCRALVGDLPLNSTIVAGVAEAAVSCLWAPPRPWTDYPLPPDWSATSDSIALWLAHALEAEMLVLVKSIDPPIRSQSLVSLRQDAIVDDHFEVLYRQQPLPVTVLARSQVDLFYRARARGSMADFPLVE